MHFVLPGCVRVPGRPASVVVFRGGNRGRSWVIVSRWRTGWRSAILTKAYDRFKESPEDGRPIERSIGSDALSTAVFAFAARGGTLPPRNRDDDVLYYYYYNMSSSQAIARTVLLLTVSVVLCFQL